MPKVSVLCTTYNHENFISKALQSVISQIRDFEIEIVICDDFSTDNTLKVCQKFKLKHPDTIFIYENEKNIGVANNFFKALGKCTGDYVAICEGDDYWIDKFKLSKQIGFLDNNLDYSICYHRVYELFPDGRMLLERLNTKTMNCTYTILDLAKRNLIYTPSVVFRNNLIKETPKNVGSFAVVDYIVHLINAEFGKIWYMAECMAVYRRHKKGAWSLKNSEYQTNKFVDVLNYLIARFYQKSDVKGALIEQKARNYIGLSCEFFYRNNIEAGLLYLKKSTEVQDSLREDWLMKIYPEIIENILNSKKYKAGSYLNRCKQIFKKLILWR